MSKTNLRKWNAVMAEIKALYAMENKMTVAEFVEKLESLRERQDKLRDK